MREQPACCLLGREAAPPPGLYPVAAAWPGGGAIWGHLKGTPASSLRALPQPLDLGVLILLLS